MPAALQRDAGRRWYPGLTDKDKLAVWALPKWESHGSLRFVEGCCLSDLFSGRWVSQNQLCVQPVAGVTRSQPGLVIGRCDLLLRSALGLKRELPTC